MHAKEGGTEKFHGCRRFAVQAVLLLVANERLAKGFGVVMGKDARGLQIRESDAVALERFLGRNIDERPGAGEIIVSRHVLQLGLVAIEPDSDDAVFLAY